MYRKTCSNKKAFTIVELLVVIVVIGILAAITIVSYSGIANRARIASIQSDLSNSSKQLKMFYVDNGYYPSTISTDCAANPTTTTNICLKASQGNSYTAIQYQNLTPQTFTLSAVNGAISWKITQDSAPIAFEPLVCPTGFIKVPGSVTYGTSEFCVMKYEARNSGSLIPASTTIGAPWISVSQTAAMTYATTVADCTGCHLITGSEWMTIAQNILSVPSNWSTGVVGSGYVFVGHSDGNPAGRLDANTDDNLGYYTTGNTFPSRQRRTLTLTNGEVIWDFAGNVDEWTSEQITNGQPGVVGNTYLDYIQWPSVTTVGTMTVNPFPSGTGISGSGSWTGANGMGQLFSNVAENTLKGVIRGGQASSTDVASGIFSLALNYAPNTVNTGIGFRVAK